MAQLQTQSQRQTQGSASASAVLPEALPTTAGRARRKQTFFDRFLRHRSAVLGAVVLLLVVLVALLTPVLMNHDPTLAVPQSRFARPLSEATPPAEGVYIFGTDNLGRDVYSRVVKGSQVSLVVGLGVSLAVVIAGTCIGMLAGFFKRLDNPLMRVMDSMMAFPGVILALAIMSVRGPSVGNVILALSIVDTPRFARVVRSVVLTLRELQYVEAAHALGVTNLRIMLRHILPNCLSPMIVQATFVFAAAVLGEAGLSFLGVGTPPEIPSWGQMLGDARNFLAQAPWTMVAPGAALMVTVLGLNLLGDGIRDLLDPRLRRQG
ncbi:MAG TPA: ABC transporter permease [Chloroflexota bacterium]|nr:ABC transporter permease [Chloroflexota bacterium]